MGFVRVAERAEIVPGKGTVVQAHGREYALFLVDGEFYCIDNACPHRDGPLGEGPLAGEVVRCPWHFWEVNVKTGEVLYASSMCVATHACKVEDEAVWIDI